MTDAVQKPLNWNFEPGIGYTVVRREDGGLYYTFSDVSSTTLHHWRQFALEHLYDSDRLTRNLYDLRKVPVLTDEAIAYAVEINSDPAARNIRVAVVVANESVRQSMLAVHDLTVPGGVELGVFVDLAQAEAWLERPLEMMI